MLDKKKTHPKEKLELHPRNKHRERYDFKGLVSTYPALGKYVKLNDYQDESIDFFNPEAVKALNAALLKLHYGINHWDIPPNYLCPPIPGRADYIHYVADLLAENQPKNNIPTGNKIKCLDIGVGANCIYPLIGNKEYGWSFVGSDIDAVSIASAKKTIELNHLQKLIELRLQPNPNDIFHGIIQPNDIFELTICNPPFHTSAAEAQAGSVRKINNLKNKKIGRPILNFGGKSNELWCEGGEEKFIQRMILQSKEFAHSCLWFTTLVSKESNLKNAYKTLKKVAAVEVKTIPMGQGNKISRIIAWRFRPSSKSQ
jgi:23S rRNA (adenine1618-N6)-methyltransferase